ncbi:two-component sensor histidine kinase, partial [Candidatus Bipolaricaulota bacterium]|nr:two-component sensor histidine kinase [Candidatus Bipolaricaulota bacterium]
MDRQKLDVDGGKFVNDAVVRNGTRDRRRGQLRIFFGYSPGVGKTYAMLEAAIVPKRAGKRVLVGRAELHGSSDLASLLREHDTLQAEARPLGDAYSRGFDLDVALAQNPDLILLDDLAHTNNAEDRNRKRWQDVEELLNAGIDVWTT